MAKGRYFPQRGSKTCAQDIDSCRINYPHKKWEGTVGIGSEDDIGEALDKTIDFIHAYFDISCDGICSETPSNIPTSASFAVADSDEDNSCFNQIRPYRYALSSNPSEGGVRLMWDFKGYESKLPTGFFVTSVSVHVKDYKGVVASESKEVSGFLDYMPSAYPLTFNASVVVSGPSYCGDIVLGSSKSIRGVRESYDVGLFLKGDSRDLSTPTSKPAPILVNSVSYRDTPVEEAVKEMDDRISKMKTPEGIVYEEDLVYAYKGTDMALESIVETVSTENESLSREVSNLREEVRQLKELLRNIPGFVFPNNV